MTASTIFLWANYDMLYMKCHQQKGRNFNPLFIFVECKRAITNFKKKKKPCHECFIILQFRISITKINYLSSKWVQIFLVLVHWILKEQQEFWEKCFKFWKLNVCVSSVHVTIDATEIVVITDTTFCQLHHVYRIPMNTLAKSPINNTNCQRISFWAWISWNKISSW